MVQRSPRHTYVFGYHLTMAKLPPGYSLQASPIQSALSEGRTEDAKRLIVEILRAGNADRITQAIAADIIKGARRKRGRQKALPKFWYEIAEDFRHLRGDGRSYEDTLADLSKKYGFSETHIRNAIAEYEAAKEAHDEATRE